MNCSHSKPLPKPSHHSIIGVVFYCIVYPYPSDIMFNKIWDQSNLPENKMTEKEVILYAIEEYDRDKDKYSKLYYDKWRKESDYNHLDLSLDIDIFRQLQKRCSDEDIIRALYEAIFERDIMPDTIWEGAPFLYNVNIPDDIIARVYEVVCYQPSKEVYLRQMQRVGYKYITEETKAKIDAAVAEINAEIRKNREDKTKQKLTAFLTTAAATKSVLSGNSIKDVVEQTITSDVDDAVLQYMIQLFDKS